MELLRLSIWCCLAFCSTVAAFDWNGDSLKDETLFDIAIDIANQIPNTVQKGLNEFRAAVLPKYKTDDPEDLFAIFAPDLPINITRLRNLTACQACRSVIAGLKTALIAYNYTIIENAVIDLCHVIAPPLGIRADPLCNGTVKLQGPHIASVLSNGYPGRPNLPVLPEAFCTFLNACLPTSVTSSDPVEKKAPVNPKTVDDRSEKKTRTQRSLRNPPPDTISVVQLTDIHVESNYKEMTSTDCGLPVCCLEQWGPGNAGILGDFHCNIPSRTIEIFLEKVKTLNPDIVLFTGDVPPHTVWYETEASQMNCTRLLVDVIAKNLSDHLVFPNIGNHETYPTNLFSLRSLTPYTSRFVDEYARLWQPIANFTQAQIDTIKEGGFYTMLVKDKLRIIAFNTDYSYTFNWYNILNHYSNNPPPQPVVVAETKPMKDFMKTTLHQAKIDGEKVLMLGHHPPGNSDFLVTESRWYEDLVLQYNDTIVLQPTGHTHRDEFRLMYDSAGVPRSMVFVSPSISAGGFKNPSMRVYYLDKDTYQLVDYDQYFLDLRVGSRYGEPSNRAINVSNLITHLYSAKEEYGLPDLTPASWHDLLTRFETDVPLLKKHIRHGNADADTTDSVCLERCRTKHICRQKHSHFDKYRECTPDRIPSLPGDLPNFSRPPFLPPDWPPQWPPQWPPARPPATEPNTGGSTQVHLHKSLQLIFIVSFVNLIRKFLVD